MHPAAPTRARILRLRPPVGLVWSASPAMWSGLWATWVRRQVTVLVNTEQRVGVELDRSWQLDPGGCGISGGCLQSPNGSSSSEVAQATSEGDKLLLGIRLASNGPVVKHGTCFIYSTHIGELVIQPVNKITQATTREGFISVCQHTKEEKKQQEWREIVERHSSEDD